MTRRAMLAGTVLLAGCGGGARRENLLPEKVGEWRRVSLKDVPASEAEEPITAKVVRRIQSASYEGPGKLEATLYELTSSAAALDAVQRWRPAPDKVIFYRDEFFAVVRYENAERQALNGFVRDLSRHLGPAK